MSINTFTLHIGIDSYVKEIVLKNISRVAVKRYIEYYSNHYKVLYTYIDAD